MIETIKQIPAFNRFGRVRWAVLGLIALVSWAAGLEAQSPYTDSHDAPGPSSRTTPICVSEIMYKPAARADALNVEFLELYNSNPFFHDIGGYKVVCGSMKFTFPAGTTIPGMGFFVIAASPSDIQSVYGLTTNVFGPYAGHLKKTDTVQLFDEVGSVLLTIPYTPHSPWPIGADGTGHSLVLSDPTYGEGDPRAWTVSEQPGGSPGGAEPAPIPRRVCINEIRASRTLSGGSGFIELYNHSSRSADLSGMVLTDNATTNRFVIPNGTMLGPGAYFWLSDLDLGFELNPAGFSIFLLSPDSRAILDVVEYLPQQIGHCFGRLPDGAAGFYPLSQPTPGGRNGPSYVSDIVINELMYAPISGNDDDQYIELYNKGSAPADLSGWKFVSGVGFEFPANAVIAPDGYLVIGRNVTNLLAKYQNLTESATFGPFSGALSHKGSRIALAKPSLVAVSGDANSSTNVAYVIEDEVTYEAGGRWGQWSAGGGSSLELVDPRANHRLAANWRDSEEGEKSSWTTIEAQGVLDNGANYESSILHAQLGLLDVGECLVDNVEVLAGSSGTNVVLNADFEKGLGSWALQGCFARSSLEGTGFQSAQSLHVRSSDRLWTGDNSCQAALTANSLAAGQTATLRFRARWLRGWPEVLLRLNGNWLEASGSLPVPVNLGTPGAPNSHSTRNAGPAIYGVAHAPPLPAAGQPVLITARGDDPDGLVAATVNYRLDPSSNYLSVPMNDEGIDGDEIAGDGIFSARIPGQGASQIVAFYVSMTDGASATSRFPALRDDNAPDRECVILFGDAAPAGKFSSYHLWVTQTNVTRWHNLSDLSNEAHDCTFVNGNRVIYNAEGRFAGSPYHQSFDTPYGNLCHYKWIFPEDDKFLGATSFNKIHQPGNGAGDDATIQREQLANLFLRTLGVPWLNRRYVAVYVNGRRRGTLMEDAQTPDGDVVKERFPGDSNGYLYKMQPWFEFAPGVSIPSIGFNNNSWCTLNSYTTTGGEKKAARFRYNYLVRRTPDSATNLNPVFALVDGANSVGSSNYVANLENIADMENWMRVFAANHAAGNWDSFGAQNEQNLYGYIGRKGVRYSLLMWDFNIVFGNSGSWSPGQNLFTVNGSDPNMASIYREPAFRRMYWRALQELVDGPLNVTNSGPLLDAKFAAFSASAVSVQNPATIKSWLTSARTSIAAQIATENTTNFTVNPPTMSRNVALLTGTAPFSVRTVLVNGVEWPIQWTGVTDWRVEVPLQPGSNSLQVVGIDIHGVAVPGATGNASATLTESLPDPSGQVVVNEIMSDPANPDADFVELFNRSDYGYDLSGWKLEGAGYSFPAGAFLAGGSYLVLGSDRLAFAEAYGAAVPLFGTYTGRLPIQGTTLKLLQPLLNQTEVVAQVRYQDSPPWPAPAIGSSLQLVDPSAGSAAGNWQIVTSNAVAPNPQWQYVTLTGKATKSILLIGLTTDGDAYVDDLKLVAGTVPESGPNMLSNGDFETPLTGPWTVSANMAASAITTDVKHSGQASLHVIASSGGPTISQAIWQNTQTLTTNASYTLSYWYLPGSHASSFLIRLSGSSPNAGHIYSLQPFQLPSLVAQRCTPGAKNSVFRKLAPFPSIWLNEVHPDAIGGQASSTGSLSPWLELFNAGSESIDLSNVFLSDNYSNLLQSPFPAGSSIAAGEFKVIFADGKTNGSTPTEIHAAFSLPTGNGSVALSRIADGQPQVIDYLDYFDLPTGSSYGSLPDGQAMDRIVMKVGTPGASNRIDFQAGPVVINEWMASNTHILTNSLDGQADDWFELYNTENSPIDLSGYFLSDSAGDPKKFRIPDGYIIGAKSFRVVWADKLGPSASGELHTNFKLSKSGTSIGLFAPSGDTMDFVTFGAQTSDVSEGRYPDGGADLRFMSGTPGKPNAPSTSTLIIAPPGDQFVYPGQTLTVELETSGGDPNQVLAFSLVSSSQTDATIDPATGVFTWTARPEEVPGTNEFRVAVTSGGSSPESATVGFRVITQELPALGGAFIQGQALLRWKSVAGKVYRLESTEALPGEWSAVGSDWTGNGADIQLKLDLLSKRRFFRVLIVK